MMSIGKLLGLTFFGVTLIMITAYSWLLEENLVSGLLFGSEFRLNRAADAWIETKAEISTLQPVKQHEDDTLFPMLPDDGTPVLYGSRDSLPQTVQDNLPVSLVDGQFTAIGIDTPGLLYKGHLLHLFRTLPSGESLHVVQQLSLAEHEESRVADFDAMANKRLDLRMWFVGGTIFIVLLIGHRIAKATRDLLHWTESLSVDSPPDTPPALPFVEMRKIATSTLATVQRERDAIEHQHRFLRFASHELRTPLAIASANTELLARHGVGVEGKDALGRLEESLNKMNNLTDTLLWLGRGEAPKPEAEDIDLLKLVNGIIEANAELAQENNVVVEIIWASKPRTQQPRVFLEILCSNLISNAIRHTRDGRVEIRLTGKSIEIENRGARLGNEIAHSSGNGNGNGLGLQLVSWVVERANWRWEQDGDVMFRRHRVYLAPSSATD